MAAEAPGFSWREVWLWAARHRCRGLLLRALTGASWQTEEERAQLRDVAFALGTHALTHTMECKRLERNLRKRGVRVLFLKGVALGLQLYGDAAARAGGDIDCLVEARAVPDALELPRRAWLRAGGIFDRPDSRRMERPVRVRT